MRTILTDLGDMIAREAFHFSPGAVGNVNSGFIAYKISDRTNNAYLRINKMTSQTAHSPMTPLTNRFSMIAACESLLS